MERWSRWGRKTETESLRPRVNVRPSEVIELNGVRVRLDDTATLLLLRDRAFADFRTQHTNLSGLPEKSKSTSKRKRIVKLKLTDMERGLLKLHQLGWR
jgi:hypothetical protein